jgi:hypothetical protein
MTLEEQYQATLTGFTGVPVIPKQTAERRLAALQEQLDSEESAEAQAILTREIQEVQTALSTGAVTEDEQEIQAYRDYRVGLHQFILASQ